MDYSVLAAGQIRREKNKETKLDFGENLLGLKTKHTIGLQNVNILLGLDDTDFICLSPFFTSVGLRAFNYISVFQMSWSLIFFVSNRIYTKRVIISLSTQGITCIYDNVKI